MKFNYYFVFCLLTAVVLGTTKAQETTRLVSRDDMDRIFKEVSTPFKFGIVLKPTDKTKLVDSPTIFRHDSVWYMTYIVFDGKGYETWLSSSDDLIRWETKGKIFSVNRKGWDGSQRAGYPALIDPTWGGSYEIQRVKRRYWMSYLGGSTEGYEAGRLAVGVASTKKPSVAVEWSALKAPVLSPNDSDVRWFENTTIYKSSIIEDTERSTGHRFVMFYNAKGIGKFESIGMAVSDDMMNWKRSGNDPLITRGKGICGDAQLTKIGDLWVMFYFGAFWKPGAFDRFACSYDLIHWTDWEGEDLISASEDYDREYAHKPMVIKWNGIVYHFYTATGSQGRVIALATSQPINKN